MLPDRLCDFNFRFKKLLQRRSVSGEAANQASLCVSMTLLRPAAFPVTNDPSPRHAPPLRKFLEVLHHIAGREEKSLSSYGQSEQLSYRRSLPGR